MRIVGIQQRTRSAARVLRPALLLTIAALSSGCSKDENLAEVSGHVTLDGQPLADAFVVFSPTAAGTTCRPAGARG